MVIWPSTADQKAAILAFVSRGGGFLGAHSATDTLYNWPEYGDLIGAYFREHPWTQPASVIVENTAHPTTSGLGDRFTIEEEFYAFRDNPRPRVQVLLRLDTASRWQLRGLSAGVGQVVRERPRLLQRARALSGDVERLAVSATIDRGDSVDGRTLNVPVRDVLFPLSWL